MATSPNEHIAETLLKRAHPDAIAESIFREKVKLRPLILRPTSPDPKINARSKRQYVRLQKAKLDRKSNKPRPLSAKQKRALCVYDIPREQQRYDIYVPLHQMWCQYMREILGVRSGDDVKDKKCVYVDAQGSGQVLVTADYHGALLQVTRSRCVSRVGLEGIVVKDTKFTFEIVTRANEVKTIPKAHTTFKCEVPVDDETRPLIFEIHGSRVETRAPDRAKGKFRAHRDADL